jgi:hypothetical protein
MFMEHKNLKFLSLVLLLAPLWWVLGFDLIVYTSISFLLFMTGIMPRKFDAWGWIILLLCSYLTVRAGFYIAGGGSTFRALAAVNNVAVLVACLFFYQTARHAPADILSRWPLARPAFVIFIFLALGVIISMAWALITQQTTLEGTTLLGMLTPPSQGLLEQHRVFSIFNTDWATGEATPRSTLMAPYPTATAANLVLLATGAMLALKPIQRQWRVLLEILLWVALLFTLTRSVFGGLLITSGLALFWLAKPSAKFLMVVLGLVLLVLILASGVLDFMSGFREGSNSLRFHNYQLAVDLVSHQAPLFGLGVKPEGVDIGGIPLGSHSTLVSLFTKGGLIALCLTICAFFVWPLVLAARVARDINLDNYTKFVLMRACMLPLIWLLFEDIDAVALNAVLLGIVLGWAARSKAT